VNLDKARVSDSETNGDESMGIESLFHTEKQVEDESELEGEDFDSELNHGDTQKEASNQGKMTTEGVLSEPNREDTNHNKANLKKKRKRGRPRGPKRAIEQKSSPHGLSLSGNSISDSNISWRNWVIKHGDAREVAQGVWDFGKEVGLVKNGEEGEVLQELLILEERDRVAANAQNVEVAGGP
jgi:hypothetical protein